MTGTSEPSQASLVRLGELVSATLGLDFPASRLKDLLRAFLPAARELGHGDTDACVAWLLHHAPSPETLQVLANHLTNGETYFFRDRPCLDVLANQVLPALIRARRGKRQYLRLWCAGCSTGEEAYTLAIIVHRLLPDLRNWNIVIRATDINTGFLQKAKAGVYGEWSFRDAPAWLKAGYFAHSSNGYTVMPAIRNLVSFDHLNLVDRQETLHRTNLQSMDLILCRNVLMYFTPQQTAQAMGNLSQGLSAEGWLVVAPGEVPHTRNACLETVAFPHAILFRKKDVANTIAPLHAALQHTRCAPPQDIVNAPSEDAPGAGDGSALTLRKPPVEHAPALAESPPSVQAVFLAQQARACANQGRLVEALAWCDRWLCENKMDAGAHYLRGVVLNEQSEVGLARDALQRAVYLDGEFVMAHVALGHLARNAGDNQSSGRYFANAQQLLTHYGTDELLPESDELTAGRLAAMLSSLTLPEGIA